MPRQRRLPFEDCEDLEILWEQFPKREQSKVAKLYGRIITRAAGMDLQSVERQERANGNDD